MRVVVSGGRSYSDEERVFNILDNFHKIFNIEFLGHGAAKGLDSLADKWAKLNNIEHDYIKPEWYKYSHLGNKNPAGAIRNGKLLDNFKPDCVIVFPGGVGTLNMLNLALKKNIKVYEIDRDSNSNILSYLGDIDEH